MSGHSKFANIKHKKEKNDAAKGKIFTMIGRELAVAVKEGGPDPVSYTHLQAVIRRLPRYYRYRGELLDEGVERISSNDLSHRMKVTASQIRQDLNNFGGFGQQGYGYNVQFLYEEIGKIMGLNTEHRIIIIGAGLSLIHI